MSSSEEEAPSTEQESGSRLVGRDDGEVIVEPVDSDSEVSAERHPELDSEAGQAVSAETPAVGDSIAAETTTVEAKEVKTDIGSVVEGVVTCLLYTSPSPRDRQKSRMPSSA